MACISTVISIDELCNGISSVTWEMKAPDGTILHTITGDIGQSVTPDIYVLGGDFEAPQWDVTALAATADTAHTYISVSYTLTSDCSDVILESQITIEVPQCDPCELVLLDGAMLVIEAETDGTYILDSADDFTIMFADCDGVIEQATSALLDGAEALPVQDGTVFIPSADIGGGTYTITVSSDNCTTDVTVTIPCVAIATIDDFKVPRIIYFDASNVAVGDLIRISGSSDAIDWTYGLIADINGVAYDGVITFDDLAADIITSGTYIRVEASCDGGITWSEDVRRIATGNITETLPTEIGVDPLIYTIENLTPHTESALFTVSCYSVIFNIGGVGYSIPVFDENGTPDLNGLPTELTWNGTRFEYLGTDDVSISLIAINKYSDGLELEDPESVSDDWEAPVLLCDPIPDLGIDIGLSITADVDAVSSTIDVALSIDAAWSIVSVDWGDGTVDANVSHTYTGNVPLPVTVTVTDGNCVSEYDITAPIFNTYIEESNEIPRIDSSMFPDYKCSQTDSAHTRDATTLATTSVFQISDTVEVIRYSSSQGSFGIPKATAIIDWGDGTITTGVHTHTYAASGIYTISYQCDATSAVFTKDIIILF